MHQTPFSENIPYGGFSQIQSHIKMVSDICTNLLSHILSFRSTSWRIAWVAIAVKATVGVPEGTTAWSSRLAYTGQ